MAHELNPMMLVLAVVAVLLADCQQTAFAKPQLTFSSSSIEDEVGHVTESQHNQVKTVAGQHQSGFVRQAKRTSHASGTRAAKPAEAALLFDGPLKGLVEMPLIKELSLIFLPRLDELLKDINKGGHKVDEKFGQNEVPKKLKKSNGPENLPADAGKVKFGSQSDGSNGLLNEDTFKIPQFLQQLGSVLPLPTGNFASATGKVINNVKPLNTINQIGSGLVKGARSSNEPLVDFNRLLEGEPKEQAAKLFKALNTLLEESVFLGKSKGQSQKQRSEEQEEEIFF